MNGCVLIWFFFYCLRFRKTFTVLIFELFTSTCTACFCSGLPLAWPRRTREHTHTVQLHRRNWFLNILSLLVGAWWEEWVGRCQHLSWVQADFGMDASSFPAQTSKSRSVSYRKDFFRPVRLIMSNVHLSVSLISLSLPFCAYWHSK